MKIRLLKVLFCSCGIFLMAAGSAPRPLTVFYTEFEIETYVPITEQNIVDRANYVFVIYDAKRIDRLVALLQKGDRTSTKFDPYQVRLLVQVRETGWRCLVDREGHISDEQGTRALSHKDFAELAAVLNDDIRASGARVR